MASDANRYAQIIHAQQAYANGMTRATRRCTWAANSCIACRDADQKVISIYDVMDGSAMHEFCQCTFTFSRVYASYQPVPDPVYEPPPADPETSPLEDILEKLFPEDEEIVIISPDLPIEPVYQQGWTCCQYNYMDYGWTPDSY